MKLFRFSNLLVRVMSFGDIVVFDFGFSGMNHPMVPENVQDQMQG